MKLLVPDPQGWYEWSAHRPICGKCRTFLLGLVGEVQMGMVDATRRRTCCFCFGKTETDRYLLHISKRVLDQAQLVHEMYFAVYLEKSRRKSP